VTLPTFGSRWLAPRLSEFAKQHPEIHLKLSVRTDLVDLGHTDFDAAIFFGAPSARDTVYDLLIGDELVPVCSPKLIDPVRRPTNLTDLAAYPLLELAIPDSWRNLFGGAGHPELSLDHISRFEYFTLGIQSAIAGLGILLAHPFLIAEDLESGRLMIPFPRMVKSTFNYYLTYPRSKRRSAAIQVFQRWIHQAAVATAEDCRSLLQRAARAPEFPTQVQSGGTPSL
jgi:DNA-binding transcriptional LysR family regulator